jgi:hypothetical protein
MSPPKLSFSIVVGKMNFDENWTNEFSFSGRIKKDDRPGQVWVQFKHQDGSGHLVIFVGLVQ